MAAPNTQFSSNPAVLSGGAFGAVVGAPSGDGPVTIVGNALVYQVGFSPLTVANGNTVALVAGLNVLDTTSHGTISGAVLNLPTGVADGTQVKVVSSGTITTVTGTISGGTVLPAVATLVAGVAVTLGYNAATGDWFHV